MKNRNVGFLIVGISLVVVFIILLFNYGLKSLVAQTCSHGSTCSMFETISFQTYLSLAIAGIILIIGLFLIFAGESKKIIFRTRKIKEKIKPLSLAGLDSLEKKAVGLIQQEKGAMFQRTLMEKLGIGKVGMTRLIDKLEAKQIVERKRRGMSNIVVLVK